MSDHDATARVEKVDLTNCDREPIHILGQVQSYGCLIAVSSDWIVAHASTNCAALLDLPAEDLIGTLFTDHFSEETVHYLRTRMQSMAVERGAARIYDYPVFGDARRYDMAIHQSGKRIIVEFELRRGKAAHDDPGALVQSLMARVRRHDTVPKMLEEAVRCIRVLTGFDRVMGYRFEEDGSGTVLAEARSGEIEPFLGLRYPASDIPQQARALYVRNPIRIISDVGAETFPIVPQTGPDGTPLDLSLAITRAVSPIHIEYLTNMGVGASMSVSILRRDRLWGLFACHHYAPLHLDFATRSAVELFGQLFNYELAAAETEVDLADNDRARDLHDRMMSQISGGMSLVDTFDVTVQEIGRLVAFDGAAIFSNGYYKATGAAPTEEEFQPLARFLNTTPAGQIYATDRLAERFPKAAEFGDRVAGLLALPISRLPRDYLVFFRKEIAQSVTWAGNPEKPAEYGPNGPRLTPRKSFEAWQEVVRGHSAPWSVAEERVASGLRNTLLEVVLKLTDESNAARKQAQEQQELLIAELNHRVRNILNLIRGIVGQGKGGAATVDEYSAVLDSRIHALARAHDQLTEKEWGWVPLTRLIETEANAFLGERAARVQVTGDTIELSPASFTTMALVIHELVTNSAKYGSLRGDAGQLRIEIKVQDDGAATLAWRESGGPRVEKPVRQGFGTTIIERSIPFELNGSAEVRYAPEGFEADFRLPAVHLRSSAPERPRLHAVESLPTGAQIDGRALVLEDNMIIAMDATDMLGEMGAEPVDVASRVSDALRMIEAETPAFVLVDMNLGDETSEKVLDLCVARGIPTLLATGYGATEDLVSAYPSVPILRKPYTIEQMRRAVADLLAR